MENNGLGGPSAPPPPLCKLKGGPLKNKGGGALPPLRGGRVVPWIQWNRFTVSLFYENSYIQMPRYESSRPQQNLVQPIEYEIFGEGSQISTNQKRECVLSSRF